MKISIAQQPFASALQTANRIISKGSSHPILTGILLAAQEGILHLSATDLETSVECVVEADVDLPGALVLPGRQLVEIISRIPGGRISIAAPEDRHQAVVTWRASEYILNGYPPDQYPSLPVADDTSSFSLGAGVLDDALRRTVFAAASDDSSIPIICGVRVTLEEAQLQTTGTDGFRIAVFRTVVPEGTEEVDLVVPRASIGDLLRIVGSLDDHEQVKISLSENHVFFETQGGTILSTVLLEGQYPDVLSMVTPTGGYTTEVAVDRRDLSGACERAALLADEHRGVRPVRLHIMEDRVVFKASSAELGEAYDELDAEVSGQPLDILFQSRYLLEGLRNIESDELIFKFTDFEGAALLQGVGDDRYSYVILPMKQKS